MASPKTFSAVNSIKSAVGDLTLSMELSVPLPGPSESPSCSPSISVTLDGTPLPTLRPQPSISGVFTKASLTGNSDSLPTIMGQETLESG